MKKSNKKIFTVLFIIIIFLTLSKFILVNRKDILLSYNEKDYKHTQILVDVEGNKSLSGYYLIDKEYYNTNKSMSKEWIEEDTKIKSLGNKYCKPRTEILKSIKNLESTNSVPTSMKPDMSIDFMIQKDKIFDNNSWDCYEGQVSIYLEDNIISINKFGLKGDGYNLFNKAKYYIINNNVKENVNKILDQVANEK